MEADEQASDTFDGFADPDASAPDATPSLGAQEAKQAAPRTFAETKKALGEDVKRHDLDEQPTKKMGALSAEDAEKVSIPKTRRSVRVFKHPSKPPPARLELPLATAQFQAIIDEPPQEGPQSSARGRVSVIALLLSFAIGSVVAWATHEPSVAVTDLAPQTSAAQPQTSEAPTPIPNATPEVDAETSGVTTPEVASETEPPAAQPTPEQPAQTTPTTPAERAEVLLEEAESLRGSELLAALEEAARADPSNPHAASAMAEFHMENDPHEALEWALLASQLRRRRASYYELVANAYERIGNLNDAAHARATAISLREGSD